MVCEMLEIMGKVDSKTDKGQHTIFWRWQCYFQLLFIFAKQAKNFSKSDCTISQKVVGGNKLAHIIHSSATLLTWTSWTCAAKSTSTTWRTSTPSVTNSAHVLWPSAQPSSSSHWNPEHKVREFPAQHHVLSLPLSLAEPLKDLIIHMLTHLWGVGLRNVLGLFALGRF